MEDPCGSVETEPDRRRGKEGGRRDCGGCSGAFQTHSSPDSAHSRCDIPPGARGLKLLGRRKALCPHNEREREEPLKSAKRHDMSLTTNQLEGWGMGRGARGEESPKFPLPLSQRTLNRKVICAKWPLIIFSLLLQVLLVKLCID